MATMIPPFSFSSTAPRLTQQIVKVERLSISPPRMGIPKQPVFFLSMVPKSISQTTPGEPRSSMPLNVVDTTQRFSVSRTLPQWTWRIRLANHHSYIHYKEVITKWSNFYCSTMPTKRYLMTTGQHHSSENQHREISTLPAFCLTTVLQWRQTNKKKISHPRVEERTPRCGSSPPPTRGAVDTADEEGWTFLISVSECGNCDLILLLLQHGAEVNKVDLSERTPFMYASANGHSAATLLLNQHGATMDAQDIQGQILLSRASEDGRYGMALRSLQHGAAVNSADTNNKTPLIHASANGYVEVALLLPLHGALLGEADNNGRTALIHYDPKRTTAVCTNMYLELKNRPASGNFGHCGMREGGGGSNRDTTDPTCPGSLLITPG